VWVVVAAALAVGLVSGGFFTFGQYLFAAVAGLGVVLIAAGRPRGCHAWVSTDLVFAGLVLMALANVAAAVHAGRTDAVAPTLAVCALPVVYALARSAPPSAAPAATVVAVSSASACAGILALLFKTGPDAERIAGIWRAGGTYEYPPALALACVCAVACVLGLTAVGSVHRRTGFILTGTLCFAVALTYDRAGAVMGVVVLALFARLLQRRRVLVTVVAAAAVSVTAVVVLARPSLHELERHLTHAPLASRSDPWSDAWRAIQRRPAFGYGPGGYPRIYIRTDDRSRTGRAHNTVLQETVEAGIAGGIGATLVILAGLARALPRLRSPDPTSLGWACVATAIIISGLYDFTWSFPPLVAVGLVALARLAPITATPRPAG
jgi:O-antigen ligase